MQFIATIQHVWSLWMNSAIAGPAYGNMSTYMGICTIKSSREIAVYIRDLEIWVTSRPWSNDVYYGRVR